MPRKYNRSGAHVRGHYRGGTWIEEDDRCGTVVEAHKSAGHGWSIRGSGQPLTHATTCWWCGQLVFFYRDENGGCVLFDSLGTPWPIHSCWEDHKRQQKIYSSIESELADLGYDGIFYEIEYEKIIRPVKKKYQVSVSGYVDDNYYFYEEIDRKFLRSHKRASTLNLIVLEVFDGNQIYPFLIPEKNADEYPVYSIVDIKGTWLGNNKEWYLLTTSVKSEDPSIKNSNFSHLLTAEGVCCSCGRSIKTGISWGLDDEGYLECHYCGKMRGTQARRDFLKNIISISEYQKSPPSDKTKQLMPKSRREESDAWLDELITWADENEISEDDFPRDKQKILDLTTLSLWKNQLTSLPVSIGRLSNLTKLELWGNDLTSIPESIGKLSKLIKLDLRFNDLTTIPESIGKLSNLKKLDLSYNNLTTIPECVCKLSSLTHLYLSGHRLNTIPESIGKLVKLTYLNLGNPRLTTIPESIGTFSNLAELDLADIDLSHSCRLCTILENIGNLNNLTHLVLSESQLTTIPKSIGKLKKLTKLDLYNNQLVIIPEFIGKLSNLAHLDLWENEIYKLPFSMVQLKKLKFLDLRNNPIEDLPPELRRLRSITVFD